VAPVCPAFADLKPNLSFENYHTNGKIPTCRHYCALIMKTNVPYHVGTCKVPTEWLMCFWHIREMFELILTSRSTEE
jgi:hypothetical protein